MNDVIQLIIFSGLTILMWGLWGFFGKIALGKGMPPSSVFLTEIFIGVICAIPILFIIIRKKVAIFQNYSWNVFGLLSGAGLAIGLLIYYLALEKGQASVIVPLTATYPVITVILSYLLLNERPSIFQWIGIALVISGSILLFIGPFGDTFHK